VKERSAPAASAPTALPDFRFEAIHWAAGRLVAGVDESGRGCLAGPVVAAAVVLPRDASLDGLDDCKRLTPALREEYYDAVLSQSIAAGVGVCSPSEVDDLNILWAAMEAMRRAVLNLAISPDVALVDGNRTPPGLLTPAESIVGGDGLSLSIAAASVVAKVTRDRMMCAYDDTWPAYGLATHKGYPTIEHYEAIAAHGPTPLHRRSFRLTRD
jgi:ribonuclease HII